MITGAAKKAWDAMLDIGREDTLEQKLAAATARLEAAKRPRSMFAGGAVESSVELRNAQALVDTRAADIAVSPQVTRTAGYIDTWQSYDYDSGYLTACPGGVRSVWGWPAASMNVASYGFGGGSCAVHWPTRMVAKGVAVDIADSGNAMGYIEASRLVVGDYWSPVKNFDYGATWTPVDRSTHEYSDAGDQRVAVATCRDSVALNLQWLASADRAALARIMRQVGMRMPMFVSVYPQSADAQREADFQVYGRFSSLGAMTAHTYGYDSVPLAVDSI